MSKIWCGILIISIVFSILFGDIEIVSSSIISNSQKAVESTFGLIGMLCFWSGIFKIFENTSVIEKFSKKLSKIIYLIFDKNYMTKEAEKYVCLNITSNLLGIGNAATVNGIKAIKELAKTSKEGIPSDNMTKFVLINTASLQLLPSSMISLRILYGSTEATKIVLPVIIITFIALFSGLIAINVLNKVFKEV